jgi:hypothetical protein
VAGSQICSCCSALANSRDAAPLPGTRSPGIVATARSAASSIRSRRSISSPRYRKRRELGRSARPDPARRMRPGCAGTCGACSLPPARPPGDAQAPQREQAPVRASRPGGISGVVHWQSPLDSSHLYHSSFAVRGCYGHCVRFRTRHAGGRLTGDGTVSDQAVTQRAYGCQGTVTVLMVMQVSCQFCSAIVRTCLELALCPGRWQPRPLPARCP